MDKDNLDIVLDIVEKYIWCEKEQINFLKNLDYQFIEDKNKVKSMIYELERALYNLENLKNEIMEEVMENEKSED